MVGPREARSSPMHLRLTWSATSSQPCVADTPKSANLASSVTLDNLHGIRRAMWLNVGAGGHPLKQADLIKLGCTVLEVTQICCEGHAQVPACTDKSATLLRDVSNVATCETPTGTPTERRCRICFMDDSDLTDADCDANWGMEGNPPLMYAPCLCKGSIALVHLGCLSKWLGSRYSVKNKGKCTYSFIPPCCDVCGTLFPVSLETNRGSLALCPSLPEVAPPFIVLSIPQRSPDDRQRPHGERFIFAPGQDHHRVEFHVGRARNCDIMLKDASVSRDHAKIILANGEFLLQDNDSQFQTQVLARVPQVVSDQHVNIVAGRTLLSFALDREG